MRGDAWTPETVARLGKLVADGATFVAIAANLGVTKNQAIGKAQRMGFERAPDAPLSARQQGQRDAAAARTKESRPGIPDLFPGAGRCVFPHGHPGEPGFGFCGERARVGGPYCDEHHARAYHAPVKRDVAA